MKQDVKVLFLDVDGVLNSARNVLAFGAMPFPNCNDEKSRRFVGNLDRLAVAMLRRVCEEMGACVVLHSTWRKHMSVELFAELTGLPMLDRTDPAFEPKSDAVACWFRDNPQFNVTHFAVVEDEDVFDPKFRGRFRRNDEMLSDDEMRKHLVLTDRLNGFMFEHALAVAHLLGYTKGHNNEQGLVDWAFSLNAVAAYHA